MEQEKSITKNIHTALSKKVIIKLNKVMISVKNIRKKNSYLLSVYYFAGI